MTKRRLNLQSSKQEREIEELNSTYNKFGFLDQKELARLVKPEIFPYANRNRLQSDISEKIIKTFRDLDGFFHRLDKKYQREIISSKAFQSFLETQVFSRIENDAKKINFKKKAKKSEKEKSQEDYETLYRLYSTMFRIGYVGLQKLMPDEFTHIINEQTKPTFDLMQAIAEYTKRLQPKRKEFENVGFKPEELGF